MGKVYFYALDLARISASQALLMGKVPTTKLDLAHSRAVVSPHSASSHSASPHFVSLHSGSPHPIRNQKPAFRVVLV